MSAVQYLELESVPRTEEGCWLVRIVESHMGFHNAISTGTHSKRMAIILNTATDGCPDNRNLGFEVHD